MRIKFGFLILHFMVIVGLGLHNSLVTADEATNQLLHETKFWIGETGPTGPIFSGPHQYPFLCTGNENGLGQPIVDNLEGIGSAVFPEVGGIPIFTEDPVGYSRNCGLLTRVDYFYFSTVANNFLPLEDPGNVPVDVETIAVNGEMVNFVIRLERGTINRFIYSIAMLAPFPESLSKPSKLNNSAWNGKLVYSFQGGVGIGHFQGKYSFDKHDALHYESLKRGYAVAYSTGNRTGTHYNLTLMEETAMMVKQHFGYVYGKPEYTVGVGGSGGAIQQYVIGQNNPDIIDAAIPLMSYPDMITQTIHIADCELLERYFDTEFTLNSSSRWGNWLDRPLIEGLVANNIAFKLPWSLSPYAPSPGSNECVNGWREISQAIINPKITHPDYYAALELYRYPEAVIDSINWSHWDDLGNIYPQDENGLAYNTLDNVGVQYGLRSLVNGDINKQEFLDINACVGGWKQPQDMILGFYPWDPEAAPGTLDPWNQANMNTSLLCKFGIPAVRTQGNVDAIEAAYESNQVFVGKIDIPIIDVRWYLEPVLDMHHTQGSFAVRARLLNKKGHANNHVIWFVECSDLDPVNLTDDCTYDATGDALDTMDQWLANIDKNKKDSADSQHSKPDTAVDACFYGDGSLLYAGPNAWDGIIDNKPAGPCTTAFPIYSTSRIMAGEEIKGDLFKCALKTIDKAITDGTYGNVIFDASEKALLHSIFPSGVCDYDKPGIGAVISR